MLQRRPIAVFVACIALGSAGISDVTCGQSVLERPPNLSGGWLGALILPPAAQFRPLSSADR